MKTTENKCQKESKKEKFPMVNIVFCVTKESFQRDARVVLSGVLNTLKTCKKGVMHKRTSCKVF